MLRKPLVVFAGLVFAACGGTAFSADDSATRPDIDGSTPPTLDATAPPSDGATVAPDVAIPNDTGTHASDANNVNDTGAVADAAGPIPCPTVQPAGQTACAPEGRECEYGSSPVVECDTVATCTNGEWAITQPNSSGKTCPTTNDHTCPLTEDGARGSACAQEGVTCDYPRSRCECESTSLGIGGVLMVDGASATPTWRCEDPAAACPMDARPPLGSSCTTEGLSCDYGSCTIAGGITEVCQDGVWQTQAVACPGG